MGDLRLRNNKIRRSLRERISLNRFKWIGNPSEKANRGESTGRKVLLLTIERCREGELPNRGV